MTRMLLIIVGIIFIFIAFPYGLVVSVILWSLAASSKRQKKMLTLMTRERIEAINRDINQLKASIKTTKLQINQIEDDENMLRGLKKEIRNLKQRLSKLRWERAKIS